MILENFLHTKLKTVLIRGLVHNQKFSYSVMINQSQSFWTLATATNALWSKEIHSNIVEERMQNKRQNLSKTEQSVKTIFFEALKLLRSENSKLTKVAYISEDHA